MPAALVICLVVIGSYLLGAIPFGYLVARARGVDILHQGSGNIGATNVGRVLGRKLGILVFVLDFAKGAIPTIIGFMLSKSASGLPYGALPVAAGLAAFLGHLFPVYLRFRGGKGVATAAGVVAVLVPVPTLGAVLTWLVLLILTRYMSVASLLAAVVLCVLRVALVSEPWNSAHAMLTLFCFLAAALVFIRHRANIERLLNQRENRLPDSPAMLMLAKVVHVLALGLWFGSVVFFTFSALLVFRSFESVADLPAAERPAGLAESFTKENGTQLAGLAVGPIFPWYFAMQTVCGALTVATAFALARYEPQADTHKARRAVLAVALVLVLIAWPFSAKVSQVRADRYSKDATKAAAAREEFGRLHAYSLVLNLLVLGLVGVGMALAARLPTWEDRSGSQLSSSPPKTVGAAVKEVTEDV
jgi:acyl-phosphate glycerol 3-phosphate acyltransferase